MLDADQASRFIRHVDLIDISFFILAIFTIAIIVKSIRAISGWASKKFPSKRMVFFGWVPLFNFLLYFIGLSVFFYIIFNPSQEFLIAFILSGLVGIGFAIKDVMASIIAGIILLIDKPFQVGDRITFEGHYGEILNIGLRSVKLLTLDESIVTIPNHRFLNDAVSSSSAGEIGMMVTADVYVPIDTDLYQVQDVLEEEVKKSIYIDHRAKIGIVGKEILGVNGSLSFMMTVKCIIKDARLEKMFQTEFLMRVNRIFKLQSTREKGSNVSH